MDGVERFVVCIDYIDDNWTQEKGGYMISQREINNLQQSVVLWTNGTETKLTVKG